MYNMLKFGSNKRFGAQQSISHRYFGGLSQVVTAPGKLSDNNFGMNNQANKPYQFKNQVNELYNKQTIKSPYQRIGSGHDSANTYKTGLRESKGNNPFENVNREQRDSISGNTVEDGSPGSTNNHSNAFTGSSMRMSKYGNF
jgi:hypothetical protein